MGWFCESPTTPTTTTQTQSMPQWYEDALQRLVSAGEEEVAAKPYEYYDPSRRVAGLSAVEERAISETPLAAGSYMPGLRSAYESATGGVRSLATPTPSRYPSSGFGSTMYGGPSAKTRTPESSGFPLPPGGSYAMPILDPSSQPPSGYPSPGLGNTRKGLQPFSQFTGEFRDASPNDPTTEGQILAGKLLSGEIDRETFYSQLTPGGSSIAPPSTRGAVDAFSTQSGAPASPASGVDLSQYMNPYTQYVTDIAQREAIRDYQKMVPGMGFQASKQGAFGGARYGVQEAENLRNLGQRLSDIETKGLESAFTAGTGLFEREAGRQLQAAPIFQNIGESAQRSGLSGLDAILKSQAIPRGLEQQRRDIDFQEYMRGQGYGMNQLGTLSGLIRGVQPGGTTVTQGQVAGQSPLATAAGLGLAGAGIYNLIWGR